MAGDRAGGMALSLAVGLTVEWCRCRRAAIQPDRKGDVQESPDNHVGTAAAPSFFVYRQSKDRPLQGRRPRLT